jgi:hypothetical protein
MENAELKKEADFLINECRLAELLASYGGWFLGGSYCYDLMCWRDLDVCVLDQEHDLRGCFEVGYELTRRLTAKKASFTDSVGGEPNGLYWNIKLGDMRQGAWKLDVWFLESLSYERHATYAAVMNARLTSETRAIILLIKEAYWRRAEYRDTVTSNLIYEAVLGHGVTSLDDFERFLNRQQVAQLIDRSSVLS